MTQVWSEDNRLLPVTVIEVQPVRVVQIKTVDSHGYNAVQVTFGPARRKINKPEQGHFDKAGVEAGRELLELRLDDVSEYEVGQEIALDTFAAGDIVDVTGTSKGRGFSGVMKRHNFAGRARHPRRPPGAPHARLDRPVRHPRPCVQGKEDGWPLRKREDHSAEPHHREGRHRERRHPGEGRSARSQERCRHGPQCCEEEGERLMVAVAVTSAKGSKAGTVELDESLFGIEPNVPVMHQVVTAQLAARRAGTHSTKTRAEVRGGGAKPWRQKGTGRARQGSTRSPHWVGGGVAHGPKPRDYSQKTPKKMVKLALRSALSDRASDNKVVVVDSWGIDSPNTKAARAVLEANKIDGKALVVVDRAADSVWKSFRNLTDVHVISVDQLNSYDVLVADYLVFDKETLVNSGAASEDK